MKSIIYSGNLNIRSGGPSGYLSNLKEGLSKIENKSIKFIYNEDKEQENKSKNSKLNKFLKLVATNSSYLTYYRYNKLLTCVYEENMNKLLLNHNIKEDDILHFHHILDFYNSFNKFKNNKKILTTHNPECFSIEYINNIRKNKNYSRLKRKIYDIQKFAYEKADYLIFPCEEALEPYYETIDGFDEIIKNKKIFYNYTGCKKLEYRLENNEFRKKYNISEDKFIVSFIGRHNYVKGYDIFVNVAKSILNKNKNIVFVSAGIGDIKGINHENFIDIGWTDDPGSIINASDVFILPNRRTYFDLILLEVLSLGKVVVISNTGGNKNISQLSEGILSFEKEDIEDLEQKILTLYNDRKDLHFLEKENEKLYNKHFTLEKFAKRYIDILEEIESC